MATWYEKKNTIILTISSSTQAGDAVNSSCVVEAGLSPQKILNFVFDNDLKDNRFFTEPHTVPSEAAKFPPKEKCMNSKQPARHYFWK